MISSSTGTRSIDLGVGRYRCVRPPCELRPAGWFVERVVAWQPEQVLAFELVTCSLPVAHLRHDHTLTEQDGGTVVTQVKQTVEHQPALG